METMPENEEKVTGKFHKQNARNPLRTRKNGLSSISKYVNNIAFFPQYIESIAWITRIILWQDL